MKGRFWVYVNHPNDKALIHEAGCSFCNDGQGMAEDKIKTNGEWHGPFVERLSVEKDAHASGKKTIRWCGHCLRRMNE